MLGIDVETYRKWIEWQFTPEMNWSNTEYDHVEPICLFDVSKDEELKEAFSWKKLSPYSNMIVRKRVLNIIS